MKFGDRLQDCATLRRVLKFRCWDTRLADLYTNARNSYRGVKFDERFRIVATLADSMPEVLQGGRKCLNTFIYARACCQVGLCYGSSVSLVQAIYERMSSNRDEYLWLSTIVFNRFLHIKGIIIFILIDI